MPRLVRAAALTHYVQVAQAAGLDGEAVIDVIAKGAAQSWQMENRYKTMNEGKYDFGFAIEWMRKDLSICIAEARRNGASLPVTALVDQFYAEIEKMGGKPVMEKSLDDYAKALNAASLKSQADVLSLAAKLELGASNAYLGVIPSFKDPALAQVAGRLAADETMHWTTLNSALGHMLPGKALSFGA